MENINRMSEHSNLMLVDIIHGNSSKYTQDDVLEAELELSRRNLSESDIEALKNKVNYIGGINMSASTSGSRESSRESSAGTTDLEEDDNENELEGSDSILVNVLIGYIALSSLGYLFSGFNGSIVSQMMSFGMLGVCVYGIYGLLNKQSFPIILLIGLFALKFTYAISASLGQFIGFDFISGLIALILTAIPGFVLYFLTKENMRKVYSLDVEEIKKAVGVGVVLSILMLVT